LLDRLQRAWEVGQNRLDQFAPVWRKEIEGHEDVDADHHRL
jgi:hypothetical protein